jgi:hypothetical protein
VAAALSGAVSAANFRGWKCATSIATFVVAADVHHTTSLFTFWRFDMATTRGRPKALTYEFCQYIWVRIEFLRVRLARPDGRLASIRCVAIALAKNGGVAEIVGGNKEMLALEVTLLENTRLAYATVETIGARIPIPTYATYVTPNATRIRNLYYEARQWTADPETEFAWRNMVRDLCGQPRKIRPSTMRFHRADI